SYAHSVIRLLDEALPADGTVSQSFENLTTSSPAFTLPKPFNRRHWGNAHCLSFDEVTLHGPWTIRRSVRNVWLDQILETSAVGAKLRFGFTGNVVALTFDFGKASSEFTYQLDGGEVVSVERDRPDWCGDSGWLRTHLLAEDLPDGRHEVEITVTHGNKPGCRGTHFSLGLIGIVQYE
ncbi:MAG: hypothetical protein K6T83_22910, partial [Alicyclobacillus sp.]|nr:hypothetical protein [Alicyclobacillus sp.]